MHRTVSVFFYTFIHEKTLTCLGFCSPSLPPTCSQVAAQPTSISCLLPELNHCNRLPAGLEYHCAILAKIRRWGQENSTVNLTSSMIPELPLCPQMCHVTSPGLSYLIYTSEVIALHSWQDYQGLN